MKIIGPENVSLEVTRLGPELLLIIRRPGHVVIKLALDVKEAISIRQSIGASLSTMKKLADANCQPEELNPNLKAFLPPPAPELPGFTAVAVAQGTGHKAQEVQEAELSPVEPSAQLDDANAHKEDESPV